MKIKLTYQNIRELVPFCKIFLDSYLPIKIIVKVTSILILIYLAFSIIFYADFYAILEHNILVCLIIIMLKNYMYAAILFIKYKNKYINIDFNDNSLEFLQRKKQINRKKSIIINENELILVVNVKLSFLNVGIPITKNFCNKEDLNKLLNYINLSVKNYVKIN